MVVTLASFLPLIPTHAGIVRICDFPRLQILIGGLAGLVALVDQMITKENSAVKVLFLRDPVLMTALAAGDCAGAPDWKAAIEISCLTTVAALI